ncbi:MAG: hypothetical protein TYPL_2690 [Candidatus Tyloplasma litorale]|nr:MAG: hypothetical protein TYPL_2690 [Mycoplasmatales bacterium]
MLLNNKNNDYYVIQSNKDWNNLKEKEKLVYISNDAYFGYRAMEKKSIKILYDPFIIDNLVRLCKESRKFPQTSHVLIFNSNNMGFDSEISEKFFLKIATRKIEEILNLNKNIKLFFKIETEKLDKKIIISILNKIYKN